MFSRTRPGGCQELTPRADRGSLFVQTSMCRRRRFEPLSAQLGPLGCRESVPRLQRRLRRLWRLGSIVTRGRQRNRGFFSSMLRGVSNACEGSKILSFPYRPRLVCSSLLHLRSSGKVNSPKFTLHAVSALLARPFASRGRSPTSPKRSLAGATLRSDAPPTRSSLRCPGSPRW
jgi:hypothetical protein